MKSARCMCGAVKRQISNKRVNQETTEPVSQYFLGLKSRAIIPNNNKCIVFAHS